jgi:hypothetical protein
MPRGKLKKQQKSPKATKKESKSKMPKEVKKAEAYDELKAGHEKKERIKRAAKVKVKKLI